MLIRRLSSSVLLVAVLLLGGLTTPAHAQDFGGRYRLTLVFGASCAEAGTGVSLLFDVEEAPALHGTRPQTEVSGRPIMPDEAPLAAFVLLRRESALEGALGMIRGETLLTLEGLRVSFALMGEGAVESGTAGAAARGTAFGDLWLSAPGDPAIDTLGFCTARDHVWSLVPE